MPANLQEEIRAAINRVSAENGSNTPDFILAQFLTSCLQAFDTASRAREKWYGKSLSINAAPGQCSSCGLIHLPPNSL